MALPTWVANGTPAGDTLAIAPGLPADIAANDILLYFLETDITANTVDAAWTQVADSPQAQGSTTLAVWWHRYNGTDSPVTTTNDAGNHQLGIISAFRGCVTTGVPYDVTSGGTATTSTTLTITGDTTTVADCAVVAVGTTPIEVTASGWANADLANVTERVDTSTAAGNDGSIHMAVGEKATAGAYGNTTATVSSGGTHAFLSIALKPPVGAGVTGTGAITMAAASLAGTGTETFTGTGAFAAAAASLSGSGTATDLSVTGTGAYTAAAASLSGTGTSTLAGVTGIGDFAAAAASFGGVGTQTLVTPPIITGKPRKKKKPLEFLPVPLLPVKGKGDFRAAPASLHGVGEVGPDPRIRDDEELLLLV